VGEHTSEGAEVIRRVCIDELEEIVVVFEVTEVEEKNHNSHGCSHSK
jgi:hypothetical protein